MGDQDKSDKSIPPGVKTAFIIAILLAAAAHLFRLSHAAPYLCDELYYFGLAKYLLAGYGYVDACFVGSPPHLQYPIFGPAFIAGFLKIFGENYYLLRAAHLLVGLAAMIPAYLLFTRKNGQIIAGTSILLTTASAAVFPFVAQIRPDLFYALFSFYFLLATDKIVEKSGDSKATFLFAMLFFWLAYLSRQAGISLLGALILSIFLDAGSGPLRGRLRSKGMLAAAIALSVAAYVLISKSGTNYTTYFDPGESGILQGFTIAVLKNIYAMFFYGFPAIISGIIPSGRNYIALAAPLMVLAGFAIQMRRRRTLIEDYFMAYCAMLVLYPPTEYVAIRLLIPLAPVIFYYFIVSLFTVVRRIFQKPELLLAGLLFSAGMITSFATKRQDPSSSHAMLESGTVGVTDWIRDNTPENAVFLSNNPLALHIYAGRKSVKCSDYYPIPELRNPETALVWIKNNDVDYIVTDGYWDRTRSELFPAIGACQECFKRTYSSGVFSVYQTDKSALTNRVSSKIRTSSANTTRQAR